MIRALHKISKEIFSTKTLVRRLNVRPLATASQASLSLTSSAESTNTEKDEPIDIANPFEKEQRKCILCQLDITPNYKNVKLLSQFQSSYTGRVYGRHITGLCKKRQEQVEKEILKAQNCALMPAYHKAVEFLHDPKLFNPEKPIRPHKY